MNLSQPFRELDIDRCVEEKYFPKNVPFLLRNPKTFFIEAFLTGVM